jgi:hypothetical protein
MVALAHVGVVCVGVSASVGTPLIRVKIQEDALVSEVEKGRAHG